MGSIKFGRVSPKQIVDLGNFLLIRLADGRARLVAKLSAHTDKAKMAASPPPSSVDYATKSMPAINRMYLNDTYGDCVIAGKYHGIGIWSGNDQTQGQQTPIQGSDNEVLASYRTICGPGDNGCVITDVLDYFQKTGLTCAGKKHKIGGYAAVDWTNKLEVQVAIYVFGGLTIGINLPDDWTCTNCTWDVTKSPIVGGHDVRAIDYNDTGVRIATWAGIVTITWAAFLSKKWIEEAYVELSPDWYGSDQLAPNGINAATLQADLAKIGGGGIPDIDPPTPPAPPVPPNPPVPPVPPVPPTPPAPPVPPTTFTINIPKQQVKGSVFNGFYVPAFTVSGSFNGSGVSGLTLPPWLVPVLNFACQFAPNLPDPWKGVASLVCSLLPASGDEVPAEGFTLPPWVIPTIQNLCQQADKLPPPWNQFAALLCDFANKQAATVTVAKSPCGCK